MKRKNRLPFVQENVGYGTRLAAAWPKLGAGEAAAFHSSAFSRAVKILA